MCFFFVRLCVRVNCIVILFQPNFFITLRRSKLHLIELAFLAINSRISVPHQLHLKQG